MHITDSPDTKEILLHKTLDYLSRLPQDKIIEVAEFVELYNLDDLKVRFK